MRRYISVALSISALCGLTVFATSVFAQRPSGEKPGAVKPKTQEAKGAGLVHITNSPDGTAFHDMGRGISRVLKGVRVSQDGEDFILYTDDLTYYRESNQALATNGVRVESRESTINGGRLQGNFNSKIITFLDNVKMSSRGPNDGIQTETGSKMRADLRKKPVQMTCDRVDYNYENRQAVAVGNIRVKQGDSSGTCQRVVYDEGRNIVKLLGNVNFRNDDGQTFQAPEVTIWVDSDKIDVKGKTIVVGPPQSEKPDAPRPKAFDFGEEPSIPLPDEELRRLRNLPPLDPTAPLESDEGKAGGAVAPVSDAKSEDKPSSGKTNKTAASR